MKYIISTLFTTIVLSLPSFAQETTNRSKTDTLKINSATQTQFPGGTNKELNKNHSTRHNRLAYKIKLISQQA